jgi:tetratricopeptide (TPR) repeat protein
MAALGRSADIVAPVEALEDQSRIPRALRLVDSLLFTHGQNADLLAARARLLGDQGRNVDSQAVADLAVDLDPRSAATHEAQAAAYEADDWHAEALAAADRALALGGSRVFALALRSTALTGLRDYSAATRTARQAVKLHPRDPMATMALCMALSKVDPPEARTWANRLVNRRRDAWGYVVLAFTSMHLDDDDRVAPAGHEALRRDSEHSKAALCDLMAFLYEGRPDDALARGERPILRDDVNAWVVVGTAHMLGGRPTQAVASLEAAIRQQPRNVAALDLLVSAQTELAEWPAVAVSAARLLSVDPDHFGALMCRARAWCETDRPHDAIRDLNRVLANQPNSVAALAIRALAHLLADQNQQALTDANAAVRAGDTTDSVAYTARMLALIALGRRTESESTAQQILRHHPNHPIARQIQDAKNTRWRENIDGIFSLAKTALGLGIV